MPLVQIPVGVTPCQIDDFPEKVGKGKKARPFERSCKGSLHLRPASTKTLTVDELEHLRTAKQHKAWGRRLLEVKVEVAKAPEAAPSVPPPPEPEPDAETTPEEGSRRGRRGRPG